jgi:hypothetical protein
MSAVLEEAIKEVRALSPEEQRRLRERAAGLGELVIIAILYALLRKEGVSVSASDLIEVLTLLEGADVVNKALCKEPTPLPTSRRAVLSGRIRGKYAHIRTSSEAFAQLKKEEIRLEDRLR